MSLGRLCSWWSRTTGTYALLLYLLATCIPLYNTIHLLRSAVDEADSVSAPRSHVRAIAPVDVRDAIGTTQHVAGGSNIGSLDVEHGPSPERLGRKADGGLQSSTRARLYYPRVFFMSDIDRANAAASVSSTINVSASINGTTGSLVLQLELEPDSLWTAKDRGEDLSDGLTQADRWEDNINLRKQAPLPPSKRRCLLMSDWERQSFPNCNVMHELNLLAHTRTLKPLGNGLFRTGWSLSEDEDSRSEDHARTLVFRTLNLRDTHARHFSSEIIEQNRIDALAMERLTPSKYGIREYAYCGVAVVTEYGKTLQNLLTEQMHRGEYNVLSRLKLARHVALALRDVHAIGALILDGTDKKPTLAHGDFHRGNILVNWQGQLVVNDFNQGILLRAFPNGTDCRFHNRGFTGLSRYDRPAERSNTKFFHPVKVDIFGLGNILIYLLTDLFRPFERDLIANVSALEVIPRVLRVRQKYIDSTDTATMALLYGALACFAPNPQKRPSAQRMAQGLTTALEWRLRGKKYSHVADIKALFADDDDGFARLEVFNKTNTSGPNAPETHSS